jgi:hypothetical protein
VSFTKVKCVGHRRVLNAIEGAVERAGLSERRLIGEQSEKAHWMIPKIKAPRLFVHRIHTKISMVSLAELLSIGMTLVRAECLTQDRFSFNPQGKPSIEAVAVLVRMRPQVVAIGPTGAFRLAVACTPCPCAFAWSACATSKGAHERVGERRLPIALSRRFVALFQ